MNDESRYRPRLQPTPPASEILGREDEPEDSIDAGTTRSVRPASPRSSRWAWGVAGLLTVGAVALAIVAYPGDENEDSVASRGTAPVAMPAVLSTVELFPLHEPARFAGQRAELDGLMVTEVVGGRFAYARPADGLNHAPVLVDLADVEAPPLEPGRLIAVEGHLVAPGDVARDGLTAREAMRLDEAPVVVHAASLVAPTTH